LLLEKGLRPTGKE
jgi:hypothetical protein